MPRTRIKFCGLTREGDVDAAVACGVDALGFVFYPPSPRYVSPSRAAVLMQRVPPFVTTVGLFVNADAAVVSATLAEAPVDLLQFHGDESAAACSGHGRPWIRAARMRAGFDLLDFGASFAAARALLVDAFVEGYGGGGKTFDWRLIPSEPTHPLILSGGLTPDNVAEAIRAVRPWAVDVSSGIESAPGIKCAGRMSAFVAGVLNADC